MHTTAKILTKSNKPIRIKESLPHPMITDHRQRGRDKQNHVFLSIHFCLTKHSKILAMYYFAGVCGLIGFSWVVFCCTWNLSPGAAVIWKHLAGAQDNSLT